MEFCNLCRKNVQLRPNPKIRRKNHVKTKKHAKTKEHVKRLRLDFIQERLAADGITTIEQAQQMYDQEQPRAMTDAEKATWRGYAVQLAWLVQF